MYVFAHWKSIECMAVSPPQQNSSPLGTLCADVMNNRLLCFYSGRHHLLRQYHLPCEYNNKIRNALFTLMWCGAAALSLTLLSFGKTLSNAATDALFLRPLFCLSTRLCVRCCICARLLLRVDPANQRERVSERDRRNGCVCSSAQNALWWLMAQKDKRKSQKCFTNDLRFPSYWYRHPQQSLTPNFAFIWCLFSIQKIPWISINQISPHPLQIYIKTSPFVHINKKQVTLH